MKITWKLALAYAWHHPMRMLLTSLAMIASACVVVWVVSGYDAIVSQFGNQVSEYLGRYDLFLVPDSVEESFISPQLIETIGKDPAIAELEPVLQSTVRVQTDKPMEMGAEGPGARGQGRGARGEGRWARGEGLVPSGSRIKNLKSEISSPKPPIPSPSSTLRPLPSAFRPPLFGGPKLVGTNARTPPYELLEGRWIKHGDPKLREAAISNQSADQMELKLGDEVLVIFGTKEYRLKIVGIVAQVASAPMVQRQSSSGRPMMSGPGAALGPAASALYVPMPLAEKITRQSNRVNLVNIKLREGTSAAEFRTRWLPQVAQVRPTVLLVGVGDLRNAMEEGMMAANAKKQAWAATGMSLLAALFIIFTTLSMGVHERVRQFAVMRAVGLTRSQVAYVIAAESLVLALIGWGGGLAAGYGLLTVVSNAKPDLFRNGASLGAWCVLLTGASAFGAALIASIFPAWQATSVQPLEAMSPRRSVRPSMKLSVVVGIVGLLLIAVNPLLVFVMPIPNAARYGVYEAIGCTSMALGFLLLTPLTIVATEAVFGPWIARLLGLEPRLLRSQLSSNLWRTLGTTVAMTVGLGLYVSMMVWGYSMLGPFRPGDWVPDMLVALQSGGLPDTEIDAVRHLEGVVSDQCIPLAVEQPRLAEDITGSKQGNSVTRQDNVIMIGLDPQVAFGGPKPLVAAKFVEGTPEEAIAKLKQGRYCIVPDHFLAATGLKIGDRFGMTPPERPDKPVEYTIAGAVSLPGWHWMTKFSGLRRRSGRSAAMVFANYDDVCRDFAIRQINFLWMNVDQGFGQKHLEEVKQAEEAKKPVGRGDRMPGRGPMATPLVIDGKRAAVVKVSEALQPIADRYLGQRQPVNAQGMWSVGASMFGQSLRVSTPDEVRTRILSRADDMIWAMCQLPLITLLVTSLGVVNTIMASVRARRWELGVLRALGVTRSAMFRMILAEGLLIGVVACLVSLAFGLMAGWCGTGISQYVSFFGGMATPLVVPWAKLALGFSAALALCLAAALWPAISAGRSEPLALLQAGRAAM
jgi:putative ABC transport system permease protein